MSLPESFRRYGAEVLARTPEIAHNWSMKSDHCELVIPTSSPNGFDIRFVVKQDAVTLYWGNWHTPFEPELGVETFIEDLFGLLRDMLSPDMRVRELYTWPMAYRGFLESFDGTRWVTEQEMGLIFWNYFGRRSVRMYSNSVLPTRLPKVDKSGASGPSLESKDAT